MTIKKQCVKTLIYFHKYKLILAIFGFFSTCVYSQQSSDKFLLEPKLSIQQTITNNAQFDQTKKTGYVTQISPGILILSNTPRIKGFADYSLDAISDSNGIKNHYIRNRLNAGAVVEAIDQVAFIDIKGSIATQPISAFGVPVNGSRVISNSAETKNFRISPYLRGNLKDNLEYEARYSIQENSTNASNVGKSTVQDVILSVTRPLEGQILGWSALASYQESDFSLSRNITDAVFRSTLNYSVVPQLVFSGIIGAESTNQLTPFSKSYKITGIGLDWQASKYTRASIFSENRYFGNSHNIALEHATPRTVWRYTDIKGISNGTSNYLLSLGNAYGLLDGFYMQSEPDPIRRRQIVMAEIERLGISTNTEIFSDFLRSTSTLQRSQNLSFALLGRRSTITFSVFRLNNQRLNGFLSSGDDFDINAKITQNGINLLMSHRLSPNLSLFGNLNTQRSIGSLASAKSKSTFINLGFNQILSRRTSASLQLNRSIFENSGGQYNESSIVGIMTHRF